MYLAHACRSHNALTQTRCLPNDPPSTSMYSHVLSHCPQTDSDQPISMNTLISDGNVQVTKCSTTSLIRCVCYLCITVSTAPEESQLYIDLLTNYNVYVRPVAHATENVSVTIGLFLQQIVNVDEKNQKVEVNAWIKATWYDPKLSWDPKKYAGIQDVRFKPNQIWTPDILLYNSVADEFDSLYAANVLVYYDGLCTWIPPGIFKFSTQIHITWFPFDEQICALKFGSWSYDGSKLDLVLAEEENGFDLSTYIRNGEWELTDKHAERHIMYYKCCPEPYFDIVFSFKIQRKTLYYGFNLIVPCIAITLLTIIGFTYPAEAGEKISIQINVLLSICIFQNYVSEMSPATSEAIPFLGTYFLFTILTVAISVVGTVVIVNIYNRTTKTHHMAPVMIKVFLRYMPWAMMMKAPRKRYKPREHFSELHYRRVSRPTDTLKEILALRQQSFDTIPLKKLAQLLVLEKMLDDVKQMNAMSRNEFNDDLDAHEWRYMSTVIDRISLYCCASFIVLSTVALFLSAVM
uniref:Neur_chan_LBD domain-containing protein n=1 Tax=Panagrellus redivivus TaxID=6233 RepID=A0A7E4ZR34_PANRE